MSEKAKLSPKEKAEIVRRCLRNEISIGTASQEVCVNKTTILRWIAQYETEGAAVFLPHRGGRIYSEEVKRQAVQEYLSGMGSLREISQKYGLRDESRLRDWVKVYNAHGDFNSRKYSGGGSYMKQGRETTLEERIKIVLECPGMYRRREELWRDGAEISGKLPTGSRLDTAL